MSPRLQATWRGWLTGFVGWKSADGASTDPRLEMKSPAAAWKPNGTDRERMDFECRDKIRQDQPVEGKDRAKEKECAKEEAADAGRVAVAAQVRAESAFVRPAVKEFRIKPEFHASSKNALNVERKWQGSSHGWMQTWIFNSAAKGKG